MPRLLAGWIGVAGVLIVPAAAGAQARVACDRTCLTGLSDRYIDALVAREPARLPLASTVKFTENGQRLDLGDGLWHTVTGKGSYRLEMADVEAGQAVLMGTIREADTPAIFVLRLGVVEQRIAEIETLVIRNQSAAESLDKIRMPRPAWMTPVPEPERHSRDELARIANMYFSGIELNDGKGAYPLAQTCARLENGSVTAGDPALVPGAPPPAPNRVRMSCLQQFQSGMFHLKGLIGPVESVLHQVPYGMDSGWSTWEDAMSTRPRW